MADTLVCLLLKGLCLFPECMFPERYNPDNVVIPNVDLPNSILRRAPSILKGVSQIVRVIGGLIIQVAFGISTFGIMTSREIDSSGLYHSGERHSVFLTLRSTRSLSLL